jgi:hypothetical protein
VNRLYGGGLFFPGAATREVLSGWLAWTASQPEEMCSSLALFPARRHWGGAHVGPDPLPHLPQRNRRRALGTRDLVPGLRVAGDP